MNNLYKYILLQVALILCATNLVAQQYSDNATPINSIVNQATYANINANINSLLNAKELNKTKFGIAIYSAKLNTWIYTNNSKQLLIPASNTKLVTTFSTYELLRNNPFITTTIATDGAVSDGTLNGNLYIIGNGDVLLSVNDLEAIADELHKLGIKSINGNIYGDASFFDSITNRFHYSGDLDEVQATAPVTALPITQNIANIIITSGNIAGKQVNIQSVPQSDAFAFVNNSTISKKKKTGISVTTTIDANGKQIFRISGTIPPNRTLSYKHFIKKPALVVAATLKARLTAVGINVNGQFGESKFKKSLAPAVILYQFNRNINDIVAIANKNSDNYVAETLFKINGAIANAHPNTAKSATSAEMAVLKANSIPNPSNGFIFNDGSGLSRRNAINAEGLATILIKAQNKPYWNDYAATLAIAGVDGTLKKRLIGTNAENNLRGKTGTLSNVSSLAGFVTTNAGDALIFAIIFNGGYVGLYKQIENSICCAIASY
ncbi:MAG: D-alanyl-D-alanine carboxypeptidase/D-alanyl-D-alanine-endopeptidase [Ignavibacteria bacterium]|jgi:PBP4 family serine-type D-alanyl-D-alanine carboxypeptidase|nr:D-alanyl-D-alanine carboxypeptidase/D-alanyl-D-alanine-endopeptidase [Ignavibacteria bacterium]